ncbi:hypothetical protein C4J81_06840 [Deltaproteobacteria bacterium Smac51]|nr:hypothetical protein C4J81_06840 [Deltaproteobacteria bacterium Smac51]
MGKGVPIYPTQLYSIIGNIIIAVLLWRAWSLSAPLSLICGLYLILAGAARFIEEAWRGESQTGRILGLPIYQWLSILMAAVGFLISACPSPVAAPVDWNALISALPLGLASFCLCGAAMGMDFPQSHFSFARLSD